MSDNDNRKAINGANGAAGSWTEREILLVLLGAIKHHNFQIDYNAVPMPVGRNASGIRQKINRMIVAFKPEFDALKAGAPLPTGEGTSKKTATPRKRKVKGDEAGDGDGTPKKRGRAKKNVTPEDEDDQEMHVKEEMQEEELAEEEA